MLVIFFIILLFLILRPTNQISSFTKERTQLLKALLPFGVIVHHFFKIHEVSFWSDDTQSLGSYIVAVFFFISGYGLSNKRIIKKESIGAKYILCQIKRLFLPLLFVAIIFHSLNYWLNGAHLDYIDVCHKWLLGAPPLPYTWFIMTYISIIVLYVLSCRFTRFGGGCFILPFDIHHGRKQSLQ